MAALRVELGYRRDALVIHPNQCRGMLRLLPRVRHDDPDRLAAEEDLRSLENMQSLA